MPNLTTNPLPQLLVLSEDINHQQWLENWAKTNFPPSSQVQSLNDERGENSLLSIELVRELISATANLSGGSHKPLVVYLLLHLENAKPAAQNALLKILEEPPSGLRLLLSTSDLTAILPTITSRCQVIQPAGEWGSEGVEVGESGGVGEFEVGFWRRRSAGEIINLIDTYLTTQATSQKDHCAAAQDETKSSLDRRSAKALLLTLTKHYLIQLQASSISTIDQPTILKSLQLFQAANQQLQVNVNPRLVLENVFFTLKVN